jgi:hypothetical protein
MGLSQAQMAPAREWPMHGYWTAKLFEEAGGIKYCSIMASAAEVPVLTFQFQIVETPFGTMVRMVSTKVPEEVQAREVRFAADGFPACQPCLNIDAY